MLDARRFCILVSFLKKWAIFSLFSSFSIQLAVNVRNKCLPMTGFEPLPTEPQPLPNYSSLLCQREKWSKN